MTYLIIYQSFWYLVMSKTTDLLHILQKRVRQMNYASFDLFKTKINCVNWQADNESDASVLYDCFHNKLSCIYEESFPVHEKTYKVFKNKYKP